jgi:hypothetical protein
MSTSIRSEQWLQNRLRVLAVDDLSIVNFALGLSGEIPDELPNRWQFCIDMLYRTTTSKLLEIHNFVACHDLDSFYHAIRTISPFEEQGVVLWNGTLVYGTDQLIQLIGKYFPKTSGRDSRLNPAFIQELKAIFAANNVPWSDAALLPVIAT